MFDLLWFSCTFFVHYVFETERFEGVIVIWNAEFMYFDAIYWFGYVEGVKVLFSVDLRWKMVQES